MNIKISVDPSLWANSILPEGYIESWIAADGNLVEAGDPVACIRIESMLHELMSPATGILHIDRNTNSVIEPGAIIGRVDRRINMR